MSQTIRTAPCVAAPRATMILAVTLALGILFHASFAGGFLGGHHMWLAWHQRLGDLLFLLPLASLIIALVRRRSQPEALPMLANRTATLALVITLDATGHAAGSLLAVHIPAAVATMALVVHQAMASTAAQHSRTGSRG
jgi:hypothetical protein